MIRKLPSISIFFPAYNEEANIAASVNCARSIAPRVAEKFEIIVVNDGSRDRTAEIVAQIAAHDSRVRLVNQTPNQGYGAAVWAGIQAAKYEYIFFTDADLQFDLEELEKLAEFVPEYPVVLGYRAPRRDPFMRILNAAGWNILCRLLFGLKAKDIDCAFKLFRKDLVQKLDIYSRGAMISAEILISLQRRKIAMKEVPVTHKPRVAGSPTGAKLSVILRAFREMLQAKHRGLSARNSAVEK